MNETLIFFKIRDILKKYQYEVCSESIKTEVVFIKTEINNKLNDNFIQNMNCT